MSVNHWLDGIRFQFSRNGRRLSRRRKLAKTASAQIASEALENRLLLTTSYINAGGPDLAGDPSFVNDSAFQNGVGRARVRNHDIDMSGVDSSLPEDVFQSVRWDPRRGSELQFDIPTTPGAEYQVDLLFSEILGGGFGVGRRVFDVSLEGSVVLDNFDIYAEAGSRTALVKSFDVTATDGNLDIDFAHVRRNPSIAGIIVMEKDGGGGPGPMNSPPTISNINNQTIHENETTGPLSFSVNDADDDPITVTASSSNPTLVPSNSVSVVGTGTNRTVSVTPVANASGNTTVTLTASDGTDTATEQFVVTVNDTDDPTDPPANDLSLMLNAGGRSVGDFIPAVGYHNSVRTSNPRRPATISNVPSNIPHSVFQSNIWSPRRLGDIEFNIPTQTGAEYQVDLLFAETRRGFFRNGRRQFDVSIDGQQVLNDFDIFATGGGNAAVVQTFTTVGDGNLDINLSRVTNNPLISGVILTMLGDGPEDQNRAPVLASISDRTVNTNSTIQLTASATDPDGDTLTYSIETPGLPGTPSINSQLGTFTWTPPNAGVFNVTLQASDGELFDTETFSVNVVDTPAVNQPPVLAPIPAQQATVGSQLSFSVSATDPDAGPGDTVSYFLDPTAPNGANVDGTSGLVTWTPSQVGTVSFPVFATDGTDSVSQTATVTVSPSVNNAPVLAPIGNQTVEANQTLTFTASATDPDGPTDTLQFSLAPGAPAGAIINPISGVFVWTPDPFQSGPVTVTVEVSDGLASDSETVTINVVTGQAPTISPIADQTVQEGTELQLTVMATDPNPNDTLTYTLTTIGLPGNAQIGASSGVFTWTPPLSDGPGFQVTVRVTDSTGLSDTESFTVAVTPAPSTNTPPELAGIPPQNVNVNQQVMFTASATDADGDTLSYFLDPTAPNGASIDSVSGVFNWTPTTAGTFMFPVLVTDGTDSVFRDVTVNVGNGSPNSAPSFGPVANQEAAVNQLFTLPLSASDPQNDTLTYSLVTTNLPGPAAVDAATGVFTWTPGETGPAFTVTVEVTDPGGLSDTVTFTVTVGNSGPGGNASPVVTPIPNQNADSGIQLTFTVMATDADGDPLEYFLDPTAPNGAAINAGTGVFTWTPAPSDAGPHSFPIFVTDGNTTVQTLVSVVVDDGPGGGGGGGTNTAPSFGPQNNLSIAATATLTATITADDPDPGDTLTYSLVTTNLPGVASVNPQTGVFTWTPPASAALMNFLVTIRATDAAGASDEAVVQVNVLAEGPGGGGGGSGGPNQAPVMEDIPNQEATVGQLLTFNVVATDADGDVLDYFFDPTAPFTASVSNTGVVTWTPTASDIGTVTFPVFVFDGTENVFKNVTIVVSA